MKPWTLFRLFALSACVLVSSCGEPEPPTTGRIEELPDSRTPVPRSNLAQAAALKLTPHPITLASGKKFDLNIPEGFEISVAAQGLHRVRFMASSPDSRIFVADMLNLTDNKKGVVYAMEGFDAEIGKFASVTPFLQDLRNPNSLAFHTGKDGHHWLYLALTDKLVRYEFHEGGKKPSGAPQTLATYPDYGLSYKYGGWHLTRTVIVGPDDKVYVSVGSSCNACEEKEAIRATISVMDLDGKNLRIIARGLRNAVGLTFAGKTLFATGMGADHLGDDLPEESMYAIQAIQNDANYGWPFCFVTKLETIKDEKAGLPPSPIDCASVPMPFATFPAHSSPLGIEYFDLSAKTAALKTSFLVALHGSSTVKLQKGYRIVRVNQAGRPEDFITGFQKEKEVFGRPAGILRMGHDAFLFTDDKAGVVYYVRPRKNAVTEPSAEK